MTDARSLAFDVLDAVLTRHRPLEQAFEAHPALSGLEGRDRAFARNLVATALRRRGQLDALVTAFLKKPPRGKGRVVVRILELGLVQLLFFQTPPHAAVSTALDLAERKGVGGLKNLINGILRRADREAGALLAAQDAARLNTPDWLWGSWEKAYGPAGARAIAQAHLAEPPLDLAMKADGEEWAATLGGSVLPTGGVRLPTTREITGLPGFRDGAWWVQDAAAQLPARLLGDVAGQTVVDLCAAPGGKTAQLAAAGASVIAVDLSRHRLARLEENLARLDLTAETVAADARSWTPGRAVDAVLLDAPCTATGTIRRHPDIPWAKQPADPARLAAVQADLIAAAGRMLQPGGRLVFATCSLQPQEGEAHLAAQRDGSLALDSITADEVPGMADSVNSDGSLRTLPCQWADRGGLDGFFIARFRRV